MHRLSAAIIVRRRDAALTVVRLPDAKFVCRQLCEQGMGGLIVD
jgi:hypothetical protein